MFAEAMEAEHEDIVVATSAETLETRRKIAAERVRLCYYQCVKFIHIDSSKKLAQQGLLELQA